MRAAPRGVRPPTWVFRDAAFDLDFANRRWWGGTIADRTNFGSLITVSNGGANGAYGALDYTGNRVFIFDSNRPRMVPRLGIWAEHNGQNRVLQSRDLTQSPWTATNCTVARNQTGADTDGSGGPGTANTGSLITATASNGTVLQSITLASSQVISSGFVKRGSGTGTVEMTQDGGGTWTNITSSINSTEYTRVNVPAATVTNPQVGFRIGTSGDSIVVDFMQLEQKSFVSSPVITTTTSRGRGSEMASFGADGTSYNDGRRLIDTTHFNRMPLSIYAEFSGVFDGVNPATIKGGGNLVTARIQLLASGVAELRANSFGVSTANAATSGLGNINKITARLNGGGGAICMNAGAIATSTSTTTDTTNTTDDHLGIGNRGAGDQGVNGYIRRITFWRRELTDGEMLELTR